MLFILLVVNAVPFHISWLSTVRQKNTEYLINKSRKCSTSPWPGCKTETTRASQKVAKKIRKRRYTFRNHMTKHHKHPEKKTNLGLHLVGTTFTKKTHPLIQEIQRYNSIPRVIWGTSDATICHSGPRRPSCQQFFRSKSAALTGWPMAVSPWENMVPKAMDGKFQLHCLWRSLTAVEDDAEKNRARSKQKILTKTAMQNPTFCVQKHEA